MSENNAAGELHLEYVRSRLLSEEFPGIDSPGLLVLLRFVIEQGAGGEHEFVQPLVEFYQLLVNPRARRLRETHFPHLQRGLCCSKLRTGALRP